RSTLHWRSGTSVLLGESPPGTAVPGSPQVQPCAGPSPCRLKEHRVIAQDLFTIQIPVAEKVLRTVAVYAGLAVLLRIAGKRDLAQLSTFDLVVMLLLSNVVQNAVIGADNSLLGGLLGAVVLIAANAVWVRVVASSGVFARLLGGSPTVLVQDGRYQERTLRGEGL